MADPDKPALSWMPQLLNSVQRNSESRSVFCFFRVHADLTRRPSRRYCTATGETEVDTSIFKGLPYTVGFALKCGDSLLDWNQDGPGNYYRAKSSIKIQPRLVVDRTCYVKFALVLPRSVCPVPGESRREFEVEVRAYALDDPDLCTRATARFMVMNGPGIAGGRRMSRS